MLWWNIRKAVNGLFDPWVSAVHRTRSHSCVVTRCRSHDRINQLEMKQIHRHTAELIHRCLEGDHRALIFCRTTTARNQVGEFNLVSAAQFFLWLQITKYLVNLGMENQESDYIIHY